MIPTSSKPSRFVVIVAVDTSPQAEDVLAAAVTQVRGKAGADLHVVHVVEPDVVGLPQLMAEARDYARRRGEEASASANGVRVTTHLRLGVPWREIVQIATNTKADLVVVGTHGRTGVERLVFGSQAELVVRRAPCPVLVVRDKEQRAPAFPEIEPPCPDCLHVQEASAGAELWCKRHATAHPRAHLHYEFPASFGKGSTLLRPE